MTRGWKSQSSHAAALFRRQSCESIAGHAAETTRKAPACIRWDRWPACPSERYCFNSFWRGRASSSLFVAGWLIRRSRWHAPSAPERLVFLSSCRDSGSDLLPALTSFTNTVMEEACPIDIIPIFFGGRLLALNKKLGGIRPIAVGLTLPRLAS